MRSILVTARAVEHIQLLFTLLPAWHADEAGWYAKEQGQP